MAGAAAGSVGMPAADGDGVAATYGHLRLVLLDLDGERRWEAERVGLRDVAPALTRRPGGGGHRGRAWWPSTGPPARSGGTPASASGPTRRSSSAGGRWSPPGRGRSPRFDLADGRVAWRAALPGPAIGPAATDGAAVVVDLGVEHGDAAGAVAVEAADGQAAVVGAARAAAASAARHRRAAGGGGRRAGRSSWWWRATSPPTGSTWPTAPSGGGPPPRARARPRSRPWPWATARSWSPTGWAGLVLLDAGHRPGRAGAASSRRRRGPGRAGRARRPTGPSPSPSTTAGCCWSAPGQEPGHARLAGAGERRGPRRPAGCSWSAPGRPGPTTSSPSIGVVTTGEGGRLHAPRRTSHPGARPCLGAVPRSPLRGRGAGHDQPMGEEQPWPSSP